MARRGRADLVGMTAMPEAAVARELALCYTSIAVVTDLDAGIEGGEGVTHAEVMEVFGRNVERLKDLCGRPWPPCPTRVAGGRGCACRHAVDGQALPIELP